MSNEDIETKLSAARTRLIIDKPFLGALVLRLPMIRADKAWCKTTATDAKTFYYNAEYINDLSMEQVQFVLAHEALHCALSHFARRQHRVKHRWDLACDFAINPILLKDGLKPPPNAIIERSYEGMTAEEIYPLLKDNDEREPHDQHIYDESDSDSSNNPRGEGPSDIPPPKNDKPSDSGSNPENKDKKDKPDQGGNQPKNTEQEQQQEPGEGDNEQQQSPDASQQQTQPGENIEQEIEDQGAPQPPPLSHTEREALSVQWKQRMAGAAQQAMQAGKLGEDMARLVDFLLQPEVPWRALLARYMTAIARDDYNYTRPSTRRGDPAVYPSLRSAQIDIVVILDTSGSISETEMQEFISEIDSIKGQMRARITLHACDSAMAEAGPWVFESWEEFSKPENIKGGGGTSFKPAFEWAERQDKLPDLMIYFTDADGPFPEHEPNYPVLWLVKGKLPIPFGQRIQLN